jgi:hypothetical protein
MPLIAQNVTDRVILGLMTFGMPVSIQLPHKLQLTDG